MTDDDYDTEPYEGPTSSPEEMCYLEQDEAWDNYAQTSAAPSATSSRKIPPYTHRVRRARQHIIPLPTTLPATPTTLHATPYVVKLDTGFTIIITAIVTVCVVAILLKSQCNCTCNLTF
jgi:hypothetical protein